MQKKPASVKNGLITKPTNAPKNSNNNHHNLQTNSVQQLKQEKDKQQETVEEQPTTRKRRGRPPVTIEKIKRAKTTSAAIKYSSELDISMKVNLPRKASQDSSAEKFAKEKNSSGAGTDAYLSSPARSLRSSSREKALSIKKERVNHQQKKVTRVQELRDSENDSSTSRNSKSSNSSFAMMSTSESETVKVPSKRGRRKKVVAEQVGNSKSETKKSVLVAQKQTRSARKTGGQRKKKESVVEKVVKKSRKIISDSESEIDTCCNTNELKSGFVTANDSNSHHKPSSILENNDYLNTSSSVDKSVNDITSEPIYKELGDALKMKKELDPTYKIPLKIKKRPYLKTSAFKGNLFNHDDDDYDKNEDCHNADSIAIEPSVSHENHNESQKQHENPKSKEKKNENNKSIMQNLIGEQKEKIENPQLPSNSTPVSSLKSKEIKEKPKKASVKKGEHIEMKKFEQQPVEKALENHVPYDKILEAIRITKTPQRSGKYPNQMDDAMRDRFKAQLRNLEFFTCGNCKFQVTKQHWRRHVIEHGGLSWIEGFEDPIIIKDWNEAVRRLINYLRIYQLESFCCPNCGSEKRSALGHLSHVYVCGQDEEIMENLKSKCEFCEEKAMPYNMPVHRKICKGLVKKEIKYNDFVDDDGDDEEDDEEVSNHSTSGRSKRKAVKK